MIIIIIILFEAPIYREKDATIPSLCFHVAALRPCAKPKTRSSRPCDWRHRARDISASPHCLKRHCISPSSSKRLAFATQTAVVCCVWSLLTYTHVTLSQPIKALRGGQARANAICDQRNTLKGLKVAACRATGTGLRKRREVATLSPFVFCSVARRGMTVSPYD